MKLTLNDKDYQVSDEALLEAKDKAFSKYIGLYNEQPLEVKIMLKGMCRAFLLYLQNKYHVDMFKSQGDPAMQLIAIVGDLLVDTLKNAEINATISNDTLSVNTIQLESKGESR